MQQHWLSIFVSQIWTIPYLVVYFVGIVLALIFWHRHPQVSLLALLGFAILLFSVFLNAGLNLWLMSGGGAEWIGPSRVIGIAGVIRSLFAVVAYGLLMAAIFGWRQSAATAYHGKKEF